MLILSNIKANYYGAEIPTLNFEFDEGVTLLLGEVGAYKTTLLKVIGGVKEIEGGEITFYGERIEELPPSKRNFSLVSRDTIPYGSVKKALMQPLKLRKVDKGEIREAVERAIEKYNLDPKAKVSKLNGDKLTDFFAARLSMRNSIVNMFDEPYHFLGEENSDKITRLIRDCGGITIVTSCDGGDIDRLSPDRLIVVRFGEIIADGTLSEVRKSSDDYIRLLTM